LDVLHATKKNLSVLMLKRCQGATDGVLGPALRIDFNGIFEEAVEGGE
jgi:hypothetical protein